MHIILAVRHFRNLIAGSLQRRHLKRCTEFSNKLNSSFDCWFTLEHHQKVFHVVGKLIKENLILHLT